MSWPGSIPSDKDKLFKPAKDVAQHKTGLKVLTYGQEDTMKTGFALSFPPPLFIFDTELGAPPLFQYFPDKDIRWCDATFLNPQGLHDASVALQSLEAAIGLLADVKSGTIVIDSGTDVWDWIQEWINQIGKHKEGTLLRFEWSKAKLKWKKILLQLMAKPVHFVMTAQPQEIYENKEPTGRFRPRVEGRTVHTFDIVIRQERWEVPGKGGTITTTYKAQVTKCRFKKGWRPNFTEITYEQLTDKLKEDLGVEVW